MVLPTAEALARLRQQWPPLDADVALATLEGNTFGEAGHPAWGVATAHPLQPCDACSLSVARGWLWAEDGGFDRCPVCEGRGFLPGPKTAAASELESRAAQVLFYWRES